MGTTWPLCRTCLEVVPQQGEEAKVVTLQPLSITGHYWARDLPGTWACPMHMGQEKTRSQVMVPAVWPREHELEQWVRRALTPSAISSTAPQGSAVIGSLCTLDGITKTWMKLSRAGSLPVWPLPFFQGSAQCSAPCRCSRNIFQNTKSSVLTFRSTALLLTYIS